LATDQIVDYELCLVLLLLLVQCIINGDNWIKQTTHFWTIEETKCWVNYFALSSAMG